MKTEGYYKYYEGGIYKVISLIWDQDEKNKLMVIYENEKGETQTRPLQNFIDSVRLDGKIVPRFDYIGNTLQEGSTKQMSA
jgi:hypothetical protein